MVLTAKYPRMKIHFPSASRSPRLKRESEELQHLAKQHKLSEGQGAAGSDAQSLPYVVRGVCSRY